jgi:hypothetical protein
MENPDLGSALHAAINGGEVQQTSQPEAHVSPVDSKNNSTTNLDNLEFNQPKSGEPSPENNVEADNKEPITEAEVQELLELKVKGFKEPVKIPKNWEDPKVQEYINKGIRFDKRMQEVARQQKDLENKLQGFHDYETKAEVANKVEAARKLMSEGHSEHALKTILGDSAEDFVNNLVESRLRYRDASPEERLQLDLDRQQQEEKLSRQRDADRIAKLEAQINARSEQVREAEFSGYLEDAKGRYDLGQWVEDADEASALNEMLNSAAMSDIIKLQKQRESAGQENITQRDIRRAYATRAKVLLKHAENRSSKLADQKIAQQTETATANAQVASTKNYAKTDVLSQWKKSGGSMSDLVDMFRGGRP